MEVEDILKNKFQNIKLEQAFYSIPEVFSQKLADSFLAGVPFAYLLGWSEFYGHRFYVNHSVLIPRSETEYLVDIIVQSKMGPNKILDVGVGSGVILLSLLKANVALEGVGVDLSLDALEVTKINAGRLRLKPKLIQSDRLKNVTETFDLIVSNPPYIKSHQHRSLVHSQVDQFEPKMALYIEDEEYNNWFREFFKEVYEHLNPNGVFYMEGHELELNSQKIVLEQLGFKEVQVIKDFSDRERFLKATV
ncbi:MAG: class I SAM-dependent methyltransferase [Bacteriovoracaceae bacterium]